MKTFDPNWNGPCGSRSEDFITTSFSEIFSTKRVIFSTSPIGADPKSTAGFPLKFLTTMAGRRRLMLMLSHRQFSTRYPSVQVWSTKLNTIRGAIIRIGEIFGKSVLWMVWKHFLLIFPPIQVFSYPIHLGSQYNEFQYYSNIMCQ